MHNYGNNCIRLDIKNFSLEFKYILFKCSRINNKSYKSVIFDRQYAIRIFDCNCIDIGHEGFSLIYHSLDSEYKIGLYNQIIEICTKWSDKLDNQLLYSNIFFLTMVLKQSKDN